MTNTRITVDDICTFITKAVEKDLPVRIHKKVVFPLEDQPEYVVEIYNNEKNEMSLYIYKTILKITGEYKNSTLYLNISETDYLKLALLCEETIPYCTAQSERAFFDFYGEKLVESNNIEDFD